MSDLSREFALSCAKCGGHYVNKEFNCANCEKEQGRKDDSAKIRYSLLPVGTVNQVVQVLEFGSKKYADNNWQKVPNAKTR